MAFGTEVTLQGPAMIGLIKAVDGLSQSGLDRYVIVGGLAVAARLGQAHRATGDVDAVIDEAAHPDAVEALLALPNAEDNPTGTHRVDVAGTKLELIGVQPVGEAAFDGLTEQQTLFATSHVWALATATKVTLTAAADPTVRATGPFAAPAALFAMKLHAIQDRSASRPEKRSSDALDLYRLLLQLDADGAIRAELATAPSTLQRAVRAATQRVLIDDAARTRGWLAASDDLTGRVSADELRYLARPVIDAMDAPEQ